jgi:ricin-type beta-trefoil lectin protein
MRLSRRFAGPLLAALMAAGATAATAVPASAATVAPYFRIGVAPQGSSFLRCLQGDLGGPLGSTVTQQPCNPDLTDASQLWLPVALGGNIYKFENIGTGRCLEARNGAVNGGAVDLWPCESTESNERWYWPPSATAGGSPFPGPNPIQTRVSGSTGFCLDVPGAQTTPGLQLQTWRCNGTLAQQFWVAQ